MNIVLRIKRFDPETGAPPQYREYPVDADPSDRVLEAILYVKHRLDGTLAVRKSCCHGICGSDAMLINGVERLACKTIIRDVAVEGGVVVLEPLRSMPLQRDLMVDLDAFFAKYRSVKPFFVPAALPRSHEVLQSPEERARFDDPTKCILCGACYSSCPVVAQVNPAFVGPAAVVQAARFIFDSRDIGAGERLNVLDAPDGAWACENRFNCTRVCPRGIKVTKTINETKRAITAQKEGGHQTA
ncbi:MAG TPA: succinate dehydrogenase iron-sulfur subunit [Chitinivibrionales bacterium]|nr:succinate dehydrogenase iron-sulfur subunit [Chitinivibrionales bacterium]